MAEKWLIIGISGVTCSGKTTLAKKLNEIFTSSKLFSQDDYFLPEQDERHTWIPKLKHINYDILPSLDMERMHSDLNEFFNDKIIFQTDDHANGSNTNSDKCGVTNGRGTSCNTNSVDNLALKLLDLINKFGLNLCIIEGFCIFNYPPVERYCRMKYFLKLDYTECKRRRSLRVYDPPDCEGYFEECAWPEYEKHLDEIERRVENVVYFDGTKVNPLEKVLTDLIDFIK